MPQYENVTMKPIMLTKWTSNEKFKRAGKISQWVKVLEQKHEALMQDLQNLHKRDRCDVSAGMMLDYCGPGTEEQRKENPWGLLASLVSEL